MEDFNNADVSALPDLTGDAPTGAAANDNQQASPEPPQPSSDGEVVIPEGEQPEGQPGGDPPIGDEGTQAPVVEQTPTGDESTAQPNTDSPSNTDFLSEMSEGRIASEEDFSGLLSHYDELKQSVENPEMLLPEGKAREAFKYAMQFNGNAAAANQSFHHIMSIDTDKLTSKELQFEAYMLKEENADLIGDPKAKDYFEAEYERDFGELEDGGENDPIVQRNHQLATNKAKGIINDIKGKFQSETPADENTPSMSADELKAYNDSMDAVLNDYPGINLKFSEDGEGMNVVLDNQEQQRFQNYVRNPNVWLNDTVENFIDQNGTLDTQGFADHMMMAMNPEKIADLAYKQGQTDAIAKREDELRNPGSEAGGSPPAQRAQTLDEAFHNALESQG